MKPIRGYSVFGLMAALFIPHLAFGAGSAMPVELRCESKVNPEGIDEATPRLSWRMESGTMAAAQTAYQIQIASDKEQLMQGRADIWDSGKIVSDAMRTEIPGTISLLSENRYWWRVRIWDESSNELPATAPAMFLTGKMKPVDWKGEWIGADLLSRHSKETSGALTLATTANQKCYFQIDLGQIRRIDRIVLHPALKRFDYGFGHGFGHAFGFPKRFVIEGSEEPGFTNSKVIFDSTKTDFPNPTRKQAAFDATDALARYIRVSAGTRRMLPEYSKANGMTTIPMRFAPTQSFFVVFRPKNGGSMTSDEKNFPEFQPWLALEGAWQVAFDPSQGGPPAQVPFEKLEDWVNRPESAIKHYSGTAIYRKSFDLESVSDQDIKMELGNVAVMAEVTLNGKNLGVAWCPPWLVDVPREVLLAKGNKLEIKLANLWTNRLIAEAAAPPAEKISDPGGSDIAFYKSGDRLQPSGLLGPVRLVVKNK